MNTGTDVSVLKRVYTIINKFICQVTMTKIKNLEMAATISNNKDITINTSFFGLCEKATYVPTGSRVKAQTFEYSPLNGERLGILLDSNTDEINRQLNRGVTVRATPVGNVRAEICQSDDRQFLAVNLLRFSNFRYDPVGEVKFFRGHDAEVVSRLFAGQ